jgi:hypothetical protein
MDHEEMEAVISECLDVCETCDSDWILLDGDSVAHLKLCGYDKTFKNENMQ